jgi:hypothetical protein
MQKILQSYLRRLTNLSGNNRSLLLLRLISDQFIDLNDLNYALDQPSFDIIKGLIGRESKISLCQEMDSRDSSSNVTSQRLKKIQRIDKFIFDERGAKDLYVGWPFVRGKLADGTLIRCPLIFFPVELVRENGQWVLLRRKDVNTTLNKTFLLAYSFYNQVTLDEELIEQVVDDYQIDSTAFRTQLYELLKNSKVEVNFNQENFTDELKRFTDYRKNQLEESEKPGVLKMYPEAVLGIFPQAGSYLVPDYLHLLEHKPDGEMTDFFSEALGEANTKMSDRVREETTFTPFRMDAFQEHALKLVKGGQSLVIQGPPGSGKSQLISNMISDYIARGKNVLLVCQKRAALDVVWDRLRSKGLNDFIGLVHDFKNDRKSIFEQIGQQIESLDGYKQQNNSLDAIYLERQFQQASRKIDQLSEELDEFKQALFDEEDSGKSVKELYLTSSPNQPFVSLNQEYRTLPYTTLDSFERQFSRYLDYFEQFENSPHFWANGVDFSSLGSSDFPSMKKVVHELPQFQQFLDDKAAAFTKHKMDYESIVYFQPKRADFDELVELLDDQKVFQFFKVLVSRKPKDEVETLSRLEVGMLSCFKKSGPEMSLPYDQLGRFQESLEAAIKARKGLFSWIKWRLTSADKMFISRVLLANGLKSNEEGFSVLLDRIDNRLNLEHLHSEIEQIDWMEDFPEEMRKIDVQSWFFSMKEAVKAFQIRKEIRSLPEFISAPELELHDYIDRVKLLMDLLDEIPNKLAPWMKYLTESQLRSLMMGKQDLKEAEKLLSKDFDALVEYHSILAGFSNTETDVVKKLVENYANKDTSIRLLHNSLALAWIDHIETKYPVLRAVSSQRLDHLTKELQQANREKRQVSRDILQLKSRERTYETVEYNRLNNRVTYRDLHHQVTKKRRIWPIRRVVSSFHEELFQLLPCWMTSPESASALFPMEQIFDLVIFDEASQCFAERGLPAMYRGKQIVVAGDDKQLKPNDLYRVRWDEESEEDIPELEIDSLLNLAKKYVPEVALSGHYRSRSLELIEFSNQHFYDGKLEMLPHFDEANDRKPAINYLQVDGIWEDNINQVEAEMVATLTVKLIAKDPTKSIGIVTFNAKQQGHVMDVLEEKVLEKGVLLPDTLFVKNIENVQGDERDVIIFTTAYAPDKKGKLRLQFGSLNQEGGENRLNVAITRAREAIYVVTSLSPSELRTADTKNPGPKLLKEYLEYAFTISKGGWTPTPRLDTSHNQAWYLRNQLPEILENDDFRMEKNLPFADLTLMKGKKYMGLIQTDDDLFYKALSAKQTHAYQISHLTEKKWEQVRFYSREWWMDLDNVKDRLNKFVKRVE